MATDIFEERIEWFHGEVEVLATNDKDPIISYNPIHIWKLAVPKEIAKHGTGQGHEGRGYVTESRSFPN